MPVATYGGRFAMQEHSHSQNYYIFPEGTRIGELNGVAKATTVRHGVEYVCIRVSNVSGTISHNAALLATRGNIPVSNIMPNVASVILRSTARVSAKLLLKGIPKETAYSPTLMAVPRGLILFVMPENMVQHQVAVATKLPPLVLVESVVVHSNSLLCSLAFPNGLPHYISTFTYKYKGKYGIVDHIFVVGIYALAHFGGSLVILNFAWCGIPSA